MTGSNRDARGRPLPNGERRRNLELRERLDEIVQLARTLSRSGDEMSEAELEKALDRIEWLADEVWRSALHGPLDATHLEEIEGREGSR